VLRTGWTHQWLELVADALTMADTPIDNIGELARRPWWR
jgi:hypothetical protein